MLPENDLSEAQVNLLSEIACMFKGREAEIADQWEIKFKETGIGRRISPLKLGFLKKGIESLLAGFIANLSEKKVEAYLKDNSRIGKTIAGLNVSYAEFIEGFHHFEDSYVHVLRENYGENILTPLEVMDRLHHKTIGLLAEDYFNIRDKTIFALAKLAESRDKETGQHLERTREYARLIAERLGADRTYCQAIYDVSPLHDIGKVGIRDAVLLKPGPLTLLEFEEMKQHTEIGARTLNAVIEELGISRGNLVMGAEIARYHHEKYDGSGYNALRGEDIPLSARIFTLADIYDALTTQRPYKPPFTHEKSYDIIIKGDSRTMPGHFDPRVLEAFRILAPKFKEIKETLRETD